MTTETTPAATLEQHWPALLVHINRYATAMTDAAMHQAASRSDIAQSQALAALRELRTAFWGVILECVQAAPQPAPSEQREPLTPAEVAEAMRKQFVQLPRWIFLMDGQGNVRRVPAKSGDWIEFQKVHELFDPVMVDAALEKAGTRAPQGDPGLWLKAGGLTYIAAPALTAALHSVLDERHRQMEAEGWTPEHDDEHGPRELAQAAACYAFAASNVTNAAQAWPWELSWFKPASERRNLEKAGALILAAIECMDRAARQPVKPTTGGAS